MPKMNPQPGEEFADRHGTVYRITAISGGAVWYKRFYNGGPRGVVRSCPLSGWPSLAEGLKTKGTIDDKK